MLECGVVRAKVGIGERGKRGERRREVHTLEKSKSLLI